MIYYDLDRFFYRGLINDNYCFGAETMFCLPRLFQQMPIKSQRDNFFFTSFLLYLIDLIQGERLNQKSI